MGQKPLDKSILLWYTYSVRLFPWAEGFEWDEGNRRKNLDRHRVSDQEAEEAFFTQPNFIFEDVGHSASEKRYGLLAETRSKRRLTVIFTLRQGKVRVISARDMSRKERKSYEKIKKAPPL
jgi:hypothetical protein